MRALLTLATLAAIAAALALADGFDEPPGGPRTGASTTRTPSATSTPQPTPSPPRLSRAQIDRQDRTSAARRALEARVLDSRPLLERLPLERGGVRIDIAGLGADDRHVVLAIDPGEQPRAQARRVYRAALRQAGDPGVAYVLEWER